MKEVFVYDPNARSSLLEEEYLTIKEKLGNIDISGDLELLTKREFDDELLIINPSAKDLYYRTEIFKKVLEQNKNISTIFLITGNKKECFEYKNKIDNEKAHFIYCTAEGNELQQFRSKYKELQND